MSDVRRHVRPGEKVLSYSAPRGVVTTLEHLSGGDLRIVTRQNFIPLIDAARELAKVEQPDLRGGTQRHRQRIASIPQAIYDLWVSVIGHPCEDNRTEWFKRLNDPDNAYMRTGGGHL